MPDAEVEAVKGRAMVRPSESQTRKAVTGPLRGSVENGDETLQASQLLRRSSELPHPYHGLHLLM